MNDWPHSPPHWLTEQGVYMVTCGTNQKAHFFNTPARLDAFRRLFFSCITEAKWDLHAWAILSNHYHFIASSPENPGSLRRMLSKLHTLSARDLNAQDGHAGRKVWFQFFDTHITFTNSYRVRLKYVHHNPVHHGVAVCAENYPWCSAAWFARTAKPAYRATIETLKTDTLSMADDFDPRAPDAPLSTCVASSCAAESGVKPPHSK
jgi:putative transposase